VDFKLKSPYQPSGDQPQAIKDLSGGVEAGVPHQVLLGVTGSGKTYTVANIIQNSGLPTLVLAHNKTLAAQLYQEFRDYFPENAVSYFVSYYDYYQPEAYLPKSDTYIEKETQINEEIDRLRLTTTANLLSRPDCIVIASVSCIYNLGSPLDYSKNVFDLARGQVIDRYTVLARLLSLQYSRSTSAITRGTFRVVGETVHLWPAYDEHIIRLHFTENVIDDIDIVDILNFESIHKEPIKHITIYPAKHFIANTQDNAPIFHKIRSDMMERVEQFKNEGKLLEAQRLEQKVTYDLEMVETLGYVNGIENYSRYFDGRQPGDAPYTLLDYMSYNAKLFGKDRFLTVIDESHITLPQIKGMHRGDEARKQTLIDYGFRLPSASDNRPLNWQEFVHRTPQLVYVSATPSEYELSLAKTTPNPVHDGVAEQLIRPTGLLDPTVEIRPIEGQVKDLVKEIKKEVAKGQRVLVTTLTKKMSEDLTEYFQKNETFKVAYLHSDVDTLDRSDILDSLRMGEFDVLVGINLLREGLDLPEVSLVAILDADKEGFLRSYTSLMQTMGRAARHMDGHVILYADRITDSIKKSVEEVKRRRQIQIEYNEKLGQSPQSIIKPIRDKLLKRAPKDDHKKSDLADFKELGWSTVGEIDPSAMTPSDKEKMLKKLKKLMNQASKNWEFEKAAQYRDAIEKLS
jgi:excinuclease ABC subunit B